MDEIELEKEFMDGMHWDANGGIHMHTIVRLEKMTLADGAHKHWFLIPVQGGRVVVAWSYWDGGHRHALEEANADMAEAGGSEHKHVVVVQEDVVLEDGTEIKAGEIFLTEKDGEHDHGANSLYRTDSDGAHDHILKLTQEVWIKSLDASQIADLMLLNQPINVMVEKSAEDEDEEDDRHLAMAVLGYKIEKGKKSSGYELDKEGTEIQSIIFPKGKFTESEAKSFIDRNDFKRPKVDETEDSYRFRQKDPSLFKRFRTIALPDSGGVKAVIGVRKESQKQGVEKILDDLPEEVQIMKADDEKRIVYGVVLEPEEFDAEDDIVSVEEIEKAAHLFLKESRKIKFRHKRIVKEVKPVESYIAPQDMVFNGPNGKQKVKKGTWVLGVHVDHDRLWDAVKSKQINAFSIGAKAYRNPIT